MRIVAFKVLDSLSEILRWAFMVHFAVSATIFKTLQGGFIKPCLQHSKTFLVQSFKVFWMPLKKPTFSVSSQQQFTPGVNFYASYFSAAMIKTHSQRQLKEDRKLGKPLNSQILSQRCTSSRKLYLSKQCHHRETRYSNTWAYHFSNITECDIDVSFMTKHSTVVSSLYFKKLWVSVLITVHCKKKLF